MTRLEKLMYSLAPIADCAVITDDINRRYFTGMKSSAGTLLVFPEQAYFIIDFRYIEKAREVVRDCKVMLRAKDHTAQLKRLMAAHDAKSIAIDSQTCTVSQLSYYQSRLGAEVVSSGKLASLIRGIRSVKEPEEIKKMIAAQRIAEKGLEHMLGFIRPGRTEKEIQLELDYYMLRNGAEALSFDTIALSGSNTSLPHGVPSDKKVESGEFVLMDFGAVVDGYNSDMTRTVCVGKPSEEMERVYDIVLRAQTAGINSVREGIRGCDLDKIARDIIAAEGFGKAFGHSLGHGVGVEIHEDPYASPSSKARLEAGNVVTVEPGIYLEGRFGVRIEDFVVVTEDGCINMTLAPKNLICL